MTSIDISPKKVTVEGTIKSALNSQNNPSGKRSMTVEKEDKMAAELMEKILGMTDNDLRDFLVYECGADDSLVTPETMSRQEVIDFIAEYYHPEIWELHSDSPKH